MGKCRCEVIALVRPRNRAAYARKGINNRDLLDLAVVLRLGLPLKEQKDMKVKKRTSRGIEKRQMHHRSSQTDIYDHG